MATPLCLVGRGIADRLGAWGSTERGTLLR